MSDLPSPISGLPKRFPELDLLRSLAVVLMILYHVLYDLVTFRGLDIAIDRGGWWLLARITANVFLLLVGISFAISYNRTNPAQRLKKYGSRGLFVLGCGMLVTVATYIADPATYVRFGILHLIGISTLLLPFFVRLRYWNLLIALLIIMAGYVFRTISVESSWLLPLGLIRTDFASVDYFPIFPWLATSLIGLVIGQIFYVDHLAWRRHLPSILTPHSSILTLPGRYALIIYLLHQPAILLMLRFFT